jgi:hypothetical protein
MVIKMRQVYIRWPNNKKVDCSAGTLLDIQPETTHCLSCGRTAKPGPLNLRVKIDDTIYYIPDHYITDE